jgi:N-acetylneuraminate synthase/N,N'-diacetyllegionaminate synthase
MSIVRIGERVVGDIHPCFIVAEIGINHNGDMDLAHRLIDAAADAETDAVKFQNYRTEDFILDRSLTYTYVSQGKTVVESQYEMFKRCELSSAALVALREHCDRRGVIFFSTPTSEEGVADLVRAGAPLLKNGSDYLLHVPLIREMARTGLPTVISTGMATFVEIDEAVRAFREAGGRDLILLHCVSSYPAPAEDVHLRKIKTLADTFGCPVGFSDHTSGIVATLGAVALGACLIEKHFTLDRNLPGPDHRFSADPAEFRSLVEAVRTVEKMLGEFAIGPAPSEISGRQEYRLSCVAARDLPAGHCLSESDIVFCRPGTGLPPRAVEWIVGRRLKSKVSAGKVLEPDDFA